ncbi:hypothetical protein [Massilibacteroides sp.]|uniref:HYC_CC_PP family protein n=1 Tax=Massilibacteroides sp. TaxID=2034766 RepID=UPI002635DDD4|nr:hypothetical protein [Massilibacteroides sp.]MDD4516155.1 hypothetical protein [Massilibacteroides sp.]
MRRKLSIIFSLLMIMIIVHPTFAMHYCGGRISEMNLFGGQQMQACCCGEDEAHSDAFALDQQSCCETDYISVDTDDYQMTVSPATPMPMYCLLHSLLIPSFEQATIDQKSAVEFAPPGALPTDDVSLSFICVFLI